MLLDTTIASLRLSQAHTVYARLLARNGQYIAAEFHYLMALATFQSAVEAGHPRALRSRQVSLSLYMSVEVCTSVYAQTRATHAYSSQAFVLRIYSTGARGFVRGHGRAQGLRGCGCGLTICCCGGAYARMLVFVLGALALGCALLQQIVCGCYCPCSNWGLTRYTSRFSHTAKENKTNTTRSCTLF